MLLGSFGSYRVLPTSSLNNLEPSLLKIRDVLAAFCLALFSLDLKFHHLLAVVTDDRHVSQWFYHTHEQQVHKYVSLSPAVAIKKASLPLSINLECLHPPGARLVEITFEIHVLWLQDLSTSFCWLLTYKLTDFSRQRRNALYIQTTPLWRQKIPFLTHFACLSKVAYGSQSLGLTYSIPLYILYVYSLLHYQKNCNLKHQQMFV